MCGSSPPRIRISTSCGAPAASGTTWYHRLGQIQLRVPPLRERPEDILPLAEHFLQKIKPGGSFSSEASAMLRKHSWTGNIRALRNIVTKAAVMIAAPEIGGVDLALELQRPPAGVLSGEATNVESIDTPNLGGIERHTIMKVLGQTNGHQQKAAQLLGISRRTLSRKLKIYETETVRRICAS